MSWGPDDIGDLTGLTAVVTGSNSGIGFETALQLAVHGAHVVMACRDEKKATFAIERFKGLDNDVSMEVLALDLSDLASVRSAGALFASKHDRLDILVNNAGLMASPYRRSVDGFELQMATNYFGHFAFTGLLLPFLLTTSSSRVVSVSSVMHWKGRLDFADLGGKRKRNRWIHYANSKLADLVFAYEFARRLGDRGASVLSVAAHPGWTQSNLVVSGPTLGSGKLTSRIGETFGKYAGQPTQIGALPSLYAATARDVKSGEYFGPSGLFEMYGAPKRVGSSRRSKDLGDAKRLWEISETLTDVVYQF